MFHRCTIVVWCFYGKVKSSQSTHFSVLAEKDNLGGWEKVIEITNQSESHDL